MGGALHVADHGRLGDLQLQTRGLQPRLQQDLMHQTRQVHMAQLHRRQVDRDAVRLRPGGGLLAGLTQHPFADGQDQAGLLGHGDEVGRRDVAAALVLPAQQDLVARRLAGLDRGLDLIVQLELFVIQGLAQGLGDAAAGAHGLIHVRLIEADIDRQRPLGPVHGQVGVVDQGRQVVGVLGPQRDADAGAAGQVGVFDVDRLDDGGAQALGHGQGLGLRRHRRHGHELVAALPGDELAVPQRIPQMVRDAAQQLVADGVAVQVVDLLEAVQVQGEQGQGLARPDGRRLAAETLQEGGAVGQAGQAVVARQMGDAALLGLTGAQVAHGVEHDVALAGVVALGRQFDRQDLARGGGQRRLDHVPVDQTRDVLGPARQALADHGLALQAHQRQQDAVDADDDAVALDRHAVHAALDQVLQADFSLAARLMIQRIAGGAGAQDQQAHARHADGENVLGVVARHRPVQRGERQDGHGRHGREVQDHDAQNHEQDRQPAPLGRRPQLVRLEGQGPEQQRADYGDHHIGDRPLDHGVDGEGPHADEVHRGHARAERQTACQT
ncbi:hypothetical protein D3C72_1057400 [compost metagenome]